MPVGPISILLCSHIKRRDLWLTMWIYRKKASLYKTRRKFSPLSKLANTLLFFQEILSPRLWENEHLFFKASSLYSYLWHCNMTMSALSTKKWDSSTTSIKKHGHGFRTGCQVKKCGSFFMHIPEKVEFIISNYWLNQNYRVNANEGSGRKKKRWRESFLPFRKDLSKHLQKLL